MSIQFVDTGDRFYISPGTAIDHLAFTWDGMFYIDSNTTGALMTIDTTGSAGQLHQLVYNASTGNLELQWNYGNTVVVIGAVATGEWFYAGMGGTSWGGGKLQLHGFFKRASGAFTNQSIDTSQFADKLQILALASNQGDGFIGKVADTHLWDRFLTETERTNQAAQQAAIDSTNLIGSNYLDGGSLANAKTSDVSNAAYYATWTSGGGAADPTYSASAPTYAPAAPTLSGTVAMSSTIPSIGIAVADFRSASVEGTGAASVAFTTPPATDKVVVALIGGYFGNINSVSLSDTRSGTWTEQKFAQSGNLALGLWTSPMPSGTASYTVTATPKLSGVDALTGNYYTLTVLVLNKAQATSLVDALSATASGTGTSISVNMPPTATPKTLLLYLCTYLNSANSASVSLPITEVTQKAGFAALGIFKRYVTSAGDYDGTITLNLSDSYIGFGIAFNEINQVVGSGFPPPLRRSKKRNR